MTIHINKYSALMYQNHVGEKEWHNYVCNYFMHINIQENLVMAN